MMVGAMEGFHAGRAREEFTKFLDYENMLSVDIKPAWFGSILFKNECKSKGYDR